MSCFFIIFIFSKLVMVRENYFWCIRCCYFNFFDKYFFIVVFVVVINVNFLYLLSKGKEKFCYCIILCCIGKFLLVLFLFDYYV